ncbi:hypothetical protein R80B4_03140 [Fibrobacteres bacterium R8-0-B4]
MLTLTFNPIICLNNHTFWIGFAAINTVLRRFAPRNDVIASVAKQSSLLILTFNPIICFLILQILIQTMVFHNHQQ